MNLKVIALKDNTLPHRDLYTELSKIESPLGKKSKAEIKKELAAALQLFFAKSPYDLDKKDRVFLEKKLTGVFLPYLLHPEKEGFRQKLFYNCSCLAVFSLPEIRKYSAQKILSFFSRDFSDLLPDEIAPGRFSLEKLLRALKTKNNLWTKKLLFIISHDSKQLDSLFYELASSLIENPSFSFDRQDQVKIVVQALPAIARQINEITDFCLRAQLTRLVYSAVSNKQLLDILTARQNAFSLFNIIINSKTIYEKLFYVSSPSIKNLEAKLSLLTGYMSSDLLNISSSFHVFKERPYYELLQSIINITNYNEQTGKDESLQLKFFGEIVKFRVLAKKPVSDWETISDLSRLASVINNGAAAYNLEAALPHLSLFSAAINLLSAKEIKLEYRINYSSLRRLNQLTQNQVQKIKASAQYSKNTIENYLRLITVVAGKNITFMDLGLFEVLNELLERYPHNFSNLLSILSELFENSSLDRPDLLVMAAEDFRDFLAPELSSLFDKYPGYQKPHLENIFLSYLKNYNLHAGYFNDLQQNINEMIFGLIQTDSKAGLLTLDLFTKISTRNFELVGRLKDFALFHQNLFILSIILLKSSLARSPFYEHSIVHTISENAFQSYLPSSRQEPLATRHSTNPAETIAFKIADNYIYSNFPKEISFLLTNNLHSLFENVDHFAKLMDNYALLKKETPSAASLFDDIISSGLKYWGINSESLQIITRLLDIMNRVYQKNSFSSANNWLHQFQIDLVALTIESFKEKYLD